MWQTSTYHVVILILLPFLSLQIVYKSLLVSGFTINNGRRSSHSIQSGECKFLTGTSLGATSKYGKHRERTPYDILGASPNDSRTEIKRKYKDLARELHPDAQIGRTQNKNQTIDFTDINEAWQILGDAQERKRYDRKLKANEFSEFAKGVGSILEFGFRTAVPIIKKTANTTIFVVEESSKAVGIAMDIFELDKESRGLEQKAAAEAARAKKLNDKLEALPKKRVATLQDSDLKLTAAEAYRMEEGFGTDLYPINSKDIQELERREKEYPEQVRQYEISEKGARLAEKQADDACDEEKIAIQKLEDAKRDVLKAKIKTDVSRRAKLEATRREKAGSAVMAKASDALKKITEKVRVNLRKKEGIVIEKETLSLRKECERIEDLANQFRIDAQQLKKESEESKLKETEAKKTKESK